MLHLFFLNEKSLRGKLENCKSEIMSICDQHDLAYEIIVTQSIAELKEKTEQYKAQSNSVYYAVGGDGTFQALVNSVDLKSSVLQYLPYGSGNNAYRTFYNQSFDLKRDILSTDTFKADLGQANGEYFVTMFGLALDSNIGNNLAKFKWLPIPGKSKYYFSILFTLLFYNKPVDVMMTVDDKTEEKLSSFISITNGPTTGGQTPISPKSSAFDGKLNAIISEKMTLIKAMKLFSKVKTGGHLNDPIVSQYLFEDLTFESNENLMYEVDGEIRYASRIEIKACRDAITLKGKCL